MDTQLEKIIDEFGLPEAHKTSLISRDAVRSWIQSNNLQELGAVYSFASNPEYAQRIAPTLTFDDYKVLLIRYFTKCFAENPNSEWTHSRYEAGWDLASWFSKMSTDAATPKGALKDFAGWLGNLYLSSDEATRRCIVDATLEHAFDSAEIRNAFVSWKEDITLATAYSEAMNWAAKGGTRKLLRSD